jgi:hypothetical protein
MTLPGFELRKRPLSAAERSDLERRGREAEAHMLQERGRSLRRQALLAIAVCVILALLWVVTLGGGVDVKKSVLATIGSLAALILFASFDLVEAQGRVKAVRNLWRNVLQDCESEPVLEIEVKPIRAWRLPYAWVLDVGEGWAMLHEPGEASWVPTEHFVLRFAASGIKWGDSFGAPVPATPLDFDWDSLDDNHPLVDLCPPALFRMRADVVSSLLAFEDGWFVLGEEKRNEE